MREPSNLLLERWRGGHRDKGTTLRLLYYAWYAWSRQMEPPVRHRIEWGPEESSALFEEIFDEAKLFESDDPEALIAVSLMLGLFYFYLPQTRDWRKIGMACTKKAQELKPEGFPEDYFDLRTPYGYFMALHLADRPLTDVTTLWSED